MKNIIIVSIMIVADVFAATAIYDVELSYNDNFMATQAKQEFLATADSISEVTFFCGRKIIPGKYNFWIADANGFQISPTIFSDSAGLFDYELVSAQFNPKVPVRKGFTYQVHIKHSLPQCSTNFYYNRDNPYSEGELIGHSGCDLAARIKGFNNFPKDLFGMNSHLLNTYRLYPDSFIAMDKWEACIDSMEAMGITWDRVGMCAWQHFQFDSTDIDSFHYDWCDSLIKLFAQDSINVLWYFTMSTKWAGSDTVYNNFDVYYSFPRNLFEPVLDSSGGINLNNYFGQYVYKFVKRYGPNGEFWNENQDLPYYPIQYYEMWNEPEWGIYDGHYNDLPSFWGDTVTIIDPYYDSLIIADGDTTSLMDVYSRLCIVGDSAVHKAAAENGAGDSIYTLAYLPYHFWSSTEWPRSDVWLGRLEEDSVHNHCDGMAFHAAAIRDWEPLFHNRQKLTLDSIWIFMKNSNFRDKFLWCTEHTTGCYFACDSVSGFPVQSDELIATLCSFSANDSPEGPLTHSFLWVFSHYYFNDVGDGSMRLKCITRRNNFEKRPPGYGFDQLTAFLKDYRFNRCLVTNNTYDTIRVYEFENPQTDRRIYVGWKEWEISGDSVDYELPLRTNAAEVEKTARDANPETYTKSADSRGWLSIALDTIPKFIIEPADSTLRRPDLVIDSIWTVPTYPRDDDSVLVYAMLRNIDTVKVTPDTIFVNFYNNDTLFATDTITDEIKPESTLVSSPDDTVSAAQGLHLGKAVANATKKFVEHNFNNNAQYRLYDVPLRPYGSIEVNNNQTYTNFPYVVLNLSSTNPNDSLNPPADSMKIWQCYGDSLNSIDSTGWISFDSTYFWYLRQEEGSNTIYVQYKVGLKNESFEYCDSIIFDKTLPTGSFVINDDSTFTNNSDVTLKNSLTDTQSGIAKIRFGNKYLKNIVKNSGFDTTTHWQTDTALYHDSLELYEIPLQTIGNYFYQAIVPESLADFINDTVLLWIDLVSDSFVGDARVAFQYIYGADTAVRGTQPYGASITIPEGTNATVSHYNLYSYFKYYPDPPAGETFIEARVGVFADSALRNSGRLFIDNFRLDVVSPADDYTRFEDHDTLKEWTLISGNGVRKVYGQFSDGAGNETAVSFDSIIVDTTKPARRISYPQNGQTISDTITIMGWAHDSLDDPPHFKQYELQHQAQMSAIWYGNDPDSIFYTPKYPIQVGQGQKPVALGNWNTYQVNYGWYNLKLSVSDSASNSNDTTISVCVNNGGVGGLGGFSGFSNYVYGLAAGNQVYIGEFNTGKIYQYNTNYELIDTFKLIDSVGTGFPLAMAIDDSGKLWVANSNSHLISKFTQQGSLLLQFAGGFSMPSGFAFDNSGHIWVSDRLHHKIKKFNQDGDSLFAFGTQGSEPGEIDRPIGIAFHDDKIYVADSKNKRVSVFDTLGSFIDVIADSAGIQMPFGLIIDSSGCLFVSDFLGDQVIEFDPYGNQLYKIDSILDAPTGLALSPDANILYVSDTRNKRVLAFQVRGEPPPGGGPQAYGDAYIDRLMFDVYPSLSAKQMNIRFQGFTGMKISLKVYDVTGRSIKTFYDNQMIKANQSISWDCKDDINRKLANGVYFVRLMTEGFQETKKAILLK
jgi:sugar lactone lactonase YvrE